jgi:hypothetical protein
LQKVVAVSENAKNRGINVGMMVLLNFNKSQYAHVVQQPDVADGNKHSAKIEYNIPVLEIDGVEYLNVNAEDVEYVVEEYCEEEIKPNKKLIVPSKTIIGRC